MTKTLLFAAAALIAACTQPSTQAEASGEPQPIPVDAAPFIARVAAHADAEMEALARGELQIVEGCVRLTSDVGNPGYLVVWPAETVADASIGAVRIRNTATNAELGLNQQVELSGGESSQINAAELAEPIPAACTGPYWIAGSQWRVVAAE